MASYWVGSNGTWTDAANHWSNTSGGSPNAGYLPNEEIDVIIDSASGFASGGTIHLVDECTLCRNFTANSGHSFLIKNQAAMLTTWGTQTTFEVGMKMDSGLWCYNPTTATLNTNNATLYGSNVWFTGDDTGSMIFTGNLNATHSIIAIAAMSLIDANDKNLYVDYISPSGTIKMGNGTWSFRQLDYSGAYRLIPENSQVFLTTPSGDAILNAPSLNFNNVWIKSNAILYGSTTYATLQIDAGKQIVFDASKSYKVNAFICTGSSGNYATLNPIFSGNNWYIIGTAGTIACDYITMDYSQASGGALFLAGTHSIDGGHNSGWSFTSPLSAGTTYNDAIVLNHIAGILPSANLNFQNAVSLSSISGKNLSTLVNFFDLIGLNSVNRLSRETSVLYDNLIRLGCLVSIVSDTALSTLNGISLSSLLSQISGINLGVEGSIQLPTITAENNETNLSANNDINLPVSNSQDNNANLASQNDISLPSLANLNTSSLVDFLNSIGLDISAFISGSIEATTIYDELIAFSTIAGLDFSGNLIINSEIALSANGSSTFNATLDFDDSISLDGLAYFKSSPISEWEGEIVFAANNGLVFTANVEFENEIDFGVIGRFSCAYPVTSQDYGVQLILSYQDRGCSLKYQDTEAIFKYYDHAEKF
jgi:hypothetical protein